MLPKLSRYLLVFVAIFTMGYVLPSIYRTFFDVRISSPNFSYSVLNKKFYASKYVDGQNRFSDMEGNEYTREEYMDELPINNFYYHLGKGTLPDSIMGVRLNPAQLRQENFYQGTAALEFSMPDYGLNPLFESASDFGITLPKDVFRIKDRMEFVVAKTNEIDEAKSKEYTQALKDQGFVFPARVLGGIPSFMKSRDDGWFIQDSTLQLFHLKMVKGRPEVNRVNVPEGFKIRKIICNDHASREFYATIVTDDNKLYLLMTDNYGIQPLPIEDFDANRQTLVMGGNLFYKTVILMDEAFTKVYVIDRDFKKVDELKEGLPLKSEMAIGKVEQFLFPFSIALNKSTSLFTGIYMKKYVSWSWAILSVVLVIFTLVLIKRNNRSLKNNILDIVLVFFTGIFGFIAVHMFPNKEY
ncbi:DUF4857 domain-containing protein [Flagellimonas olearia]|uniref:DUF4857 domain-containing protein n=1 Tax=Flagellimonas olearia TaxID=552546 RepID=A0A6I1DZF7_9FLAO|nr:DUF4857 domain-containing protein [Allomuricauda olearia]KAB7530227.1 DUF4857 domain-containing protein [Allomuricauda olearia]